MQLDYFRDCVMLLPFCSGLSWLTHRAVRESSHGSRLYPMPLPNWALKTPRKQGDYKERKILNCLFCHLRKNVTSINLFSNNKSPKPFGVLKLNSISQSQQADGITCPFSSINFFLFCFVWSSLLKSYLNSKWSLELRW